VSFLNAVSPRHIHGRRKPTGPENKQGANAWHARSVNEVLRLVDATDAGLTTTEANKRLMESGPNRLPEQVPATLWQIFARQFKNPLIYILAIAAMVAAIIGDYKDSLFIVAVLVLNAIIGSYHEARAEKSTRALQKLLKLRATVMRNGEVVELDAEHIVPGDIVWLESGNRVPADIRLLGANGLEVDESLLTGESIAVVKDPGWVGEEITPLADRRNMVYSGSMVAHGRSHGVVVATGASSSVGQLALDVLAVDQGKPPLVERMERFSHWIAVAVLAAAVLLAVVGIVAYKYPMGEMLIFSIALVVSAIPEGLPVALTVALAVGTSRMAQRGVIIRRLAAVEGLGSCTLIASDKTGTLTCNELTVKEIDLPNGKSFMVTGQGFAPTGQVLIEGQPIHLLEHPELAALARAAVLCNEADLHQRDEGWLWRGDPTDIALLSMAHKLGLKREIMLERHPQINSIPFEPERRFAASYHLIEDQVIVFVKGAHERVVAMCADQTQAKQALAAAESMAACGYRVLALAQGALASKLDSASTPPEPTSLSLLGLVGIIDPLRPGVRDAVAAARNAGIKTIMVTGDHPITALAIARELGLAERPDEVVSGAILMDKDASALPALINKVGVFARVSPHQKLQIVQAAARAGHFVAVTGDGVNDAPALRAANIGVAMGRGGTDVAREAAEVVITDDHYATITAGIEQGRIVYDNVRKVIFLLVSTGAAEIVLVSLAVLAGLPLPLLPAQLLWLNLVTNGIQDVALAFEPGEGDVLKRQPRPPREGIFNRLMIERTVIAATVMGVVGFVIFQALLSIGWTEGSARNALLLLMVLFENIHIFNCRSETLSAFRMSPLRSPILMAGMLTAFLVHVLMLYLPAGRQLLGTEPVGLATWIGLSLAALSILLVMELHKLIRSRFERASGES
jgi:magnesium-transporting ATPase (P-type)